MVLNAVAAICAMQQMGKPSENQAKARHYIMNSLVLLHHNMNYSLHFSILITLHIYSIFKLCH